MMRWPLLFGALFVPQVLTAADIPEGMILVPKDEIMELRFHLNMLRQRNEEIEEKFRGYIKGTNCT